MFILAFTQLEITFCFQVRIVSISRFVANPSIAHRFPSRLLFVCY